MGSLFSSEGTSWKCKGTVSFSGLNDCVNGFSRIGSGEMSLS